MARRHHYRRRQKEPAELEVTTFLNLMVVLVPFLLITAVFSRITIVELNLPSSTGGPSVADPGFRLEVVVREGGLEITNGTAVIAAIPKAEDEEYDLAKLSEYVLELKREYPDTDAASVLLEPQIPYDYLIQVMDVVRSAEVSGAEAEGMLDADGEEVVVTEGMLARVALFPEISIGDAP